MGPAERANGGTQRSADDDRRQDGAAACCLLSAASERPHVHCAEPNITSSCHGPWAADKLYILCMFDFFEAL
jgi:hypothetical protein